MKSNNKDSFSLYTCMYIQTLKPNLSSITLLSEVILFKSVWLQWCKTGIHDTGIQQWGFFLRGVIFKVIFQSDIILKNSFASVQLPLPSFFTLIFHLLSGPWDPKGWGRLPARGGAAGAVRAACACSRQSWKQHRPVWRAVSTLPNSWSRQRSWRRHNRTIYATATLLESLCASGLTLNLNSG